MPTLSHSHETMAGNVWFRVIWYEENWLHSPWCATFSSWCHYLLKTHSGRFTMTNYGTYMQDYVGIQMAQDVAWILHFFLGKKSNRVITFPIRFFGWERPKSTRAFETSKNSTTVLQKYCFFLLFWNMLMYYYLNVNLSCSIIDSLILIIIYSPFSWIKNRSIIVLLNNMFFYALLCHHYKHWTG